MIPGNCKDTTSKQGGPLPVISGVVSPINEWPYKWVTGVITLLIGVITPFIT